MAILQKYFRCFALLMSFTTLLYPQKRERIAVLPLCGSSETYLAGITIENTLLELFTSKNKFEVVERSELERVLSEQRLGLSGLVSESSAIRVGEMLGADFLLLGSITNAEILYTVNRNCYLYVGKVTANVKIVETETGAIIGSITESAFSHRYGQGFLSPSEELFILASQNLAKNHLYYKIWNFFPEEGYVIQIVGQEGDKVRALVDLGSETGVQKGDRFIVFRRNGSIIHPVTGGRIPGKMVKLAEGKVKEVDAFTSVIEIKTEAYINVGDQVRSKEKKRSVWNQLLDGR